MFTTFISQCLHGSIFCFQAQTQEKNYIEALEFYKEGLKIEPGRKVLADELKNLQKIIMKVRHTLDNFPNSL